MLGIELPSGYNVATTVWSPSSVSVSAGGSATATFTFGTNSSPPTRTSTFFLYTTLFRSSHDVGVSVTVSSAGDFSISSNPTSSTVTQGGTASYTVTIQSLNNFSGTVKHARH